MPVAVNQILLRELNTLALFAKVLGLLFLSVEFWQVIRFLNNPCIPVCSRYSWLSSTQSLLNMYMLCLMWSNLFHFSSIFDIIGSKTRSCHCPVYYLFV